MSNTKHDLSIWVEKFTDNLYTWAYTRTNNKETSEDLVQETFLAASKSLYQFKEDSSPKTWLMSILKNKIADYYRQKFKLPLINESQLSIQENRIPLDQYFRGNGNWHKSTEPDNLCNLSPELLDNPDFLAIFRSCLSKLNEKGYLAIQYKFLDEKDGHTICQELSISPSNFWQIIHRAKLQLRECIEFNWFKE